MATFKATFFFDGRTSGWTESYYRTDANNNHFNQYDFALDLGTRRAQLLGRECNIKAIRISTEGIIGDALLRYVDLRTRPTRVTPGGAPVALPKTSAQKDVALLLRCHDAIGARHKFIYLRGIWDSVEDQNGLYTPTGDWVAALAQFHSGLTGGGWGWMGVTARSVQRLVSAVTDPDSLVTFTFGGPIFQGVPLGQRVRVRISGVNDGESILNRVHMVQVLGPTTAKTEFSTAIPATVKGGRGAYNTLGFIDIAGVDAQKITTRETGAPLLESRGRRRRNTRG